MKYIFLISLFVSSLQAVDQSLIHRPDPKLPEKPISGLWEMDGRQISVSQNEEGNLTKIKIGDETEFYLSEYKFVTDVQIPESKDVIIFNLASWSNLSLGLNAEGIIYVLPKMKSMGWTGPLEIVECLSPEYLRNLDGYRRSVVEVGDSERFPIVQVKLLYYRTRAAKSEVGYEWVEWNLRTRLPLSELSPSGWRAAGN